MKYLSRVANFWLIRNGLPTVYNNYFKSFLHSSAFLNVKGVPINMPSLSPTMMEGTIVKWLKKEGEPIEAGDVICDIQTDKAIVSFEVEEEGVLAKILVGEDAKDIKVGTLIALMVEEGEDWQSVEMPEGASDSGVVAEKQTSESTSLETATKGKSEVEHYGPSVRLLLEKYGLTSAQVPAAGPHGILLKGDVLRYVNEKHLQPQPLDAVPPPSVPSSKPPAPSEVLVDLGPKAVPSPRVESGDGYSDVEVTNMRRTIAKRLLQSKSSIAHTYSTLECRLDAILALRKQFKEDGIVVSVNDFIIKGVGVALSRCPEVNCIWEGGQLVQQREIDISVAVATDSGLITPIVKGVQSLGLANIAESVKDLAGRARANKLKLDEFQGGSFTISNLGMFGINEFTAIINPPQCAILAVGGGRVELDEEGKPETRMNATLSYDQSAISDDTAAIFMECLKEILEDPKSMLLGSFSRNIDHPLAALL